MKKINPNNYQLQLDFLELAKQPPLQPISICDKIHHNISQIRTEYVEEHGKIVKCGLKDNYFLLKKGIERYEKEYSYYVLDVQGIYIGRQHEYFIAYSCRFPPSRDNRWFLEINSINGPFRYDCYYFRNQNDMIKFVQSEFTDKSLIYDQDEFYMESNGWRYDKQNLKRKKKEIIEEEQEEDW